MFRHNFNFFTTRDSLVALFNNTGLVYNEWYFLDENLVLFIAVNPKINIYVDNSIDIDKYSSTLISLINETLNSTGRTGIGNDGDKPVRFDEFEGRINFISTDIQQLRKSQLTSQTTSLNRDDIYDDSWAVIIGIDKYKYSDQLNYAVKDAEAVKDMLINKFDFPEDNIKYLVNEEATLSEIKLALDDISTSADENDRILVFYSGHGETIQGIDGTEKGYIIPYEGKQKKAYATGLAMDEILTISMLSKSKHMLFLMDACYSGLMTQQFKGLAKPTEEGYLTKVANESARQIITAGGREEQVIERDEWQHSAFTKNLLEGLETWEADYNDDGCITADELSSYLREHVTEDSDFQQTPQDGRFRNSGGGEFVFFSDATVTTPITNLYKENEIIYGCMDLEANNYNPNATNPDRSCQYGKVLTSLSFGYYDSVTGEIPIFIDTNENLSGFIILGIIIAVLYSIFLAKCEPIFADVLDKDSNINPQIIMKIIGEIRKVGAVVVAHLYGFPAIINEIKNICLKKNILIIKDLAQTFVIPNSKKINFSNQSDISVISFGPTKVLDIGGGGGLLTDNDALAIKARKMLGKINIFNYETEQLKKIYKNLYYYVIDGVKQNDNYYKLYDIFPNIFENLFINKKCY